MKKGPRAIRLAAGVLVLVLLASLGLLLSPAYISNWKLQRYIDRVVENRPSPGAADSVRAQVVNQAAAMGLPIRSDDVHVEIYPGSVRVTVLYVVRVDLAGYTVDLHFRPAAVAD